MTARKLSRRATLRGGAAASALVAVPAISRAEKSDPVIELARRFYEAETEACAVQVRADKLHIAAMKGRKCPSVIVNYRLSLANDEIEHKPVYATSPREIHQTFMVRATMCGPLRDAHDAACDKLLAELAEKRRELAAHMKQCGVTDAEREAEAAWGRFNAVEKKLFATPATTLAGAAVKARVALYLNRGSEGDWCDERADKALADLDRLAGVS